MSKQVNLDPQHRTHRHQAWWAVPMLLVAFMVFTAANQAADNTPCRALDIEVDQMDGMYFVDAPSLKTTITDGFALLDQPLSKLPYAELHQTILAHPGVASCSIVPTLGGTLQISVRQQRPLARVWSADSTLYLDDQGHWFPLSNRYTADVPIIHVQQASDARAALPLLKYMDTHSFWNLFIDQIEVQPDGQVSFLPRIGELTVNLGHGTEDQQRMHGQLQQLHTFYTALLDSGDLRQYRELDLRYEGQLVARK